MDFGEFDPGFTSMTDGRGDTGLSGTLTFTLFELRLVLWAVAALALPAGAWCVWHGWDASANATGFASMATEIGLALLVLSPVALIGERIATRILQG